MVPSIFETTVQILLSSYVRCACSRAGYSAALILRLHIRTLGHQALRSARHHSTSELHNAILSAMRHKSYPLAHDGSCCSIYA